MSVSDTGVVDSIPIFFLIDTTSSMKGGAIAAVNSSLQFIVDRVNRESPAAANSLSLSLIGFDGEASVILPPTLLSKADLPEVEVSNSGATLLAGALQLAVDLAPQHRGIVEALKPILVVLLGGLPQDRNSIEFSDALEAVKSKFGQKFVFAALPISKQSTYDFLVENTTFSYVCDEDFVGAMFDKVAAYCLETFDFTHVDSPAPGTPGPGGQGGNVASPITGHPGATRWDPEWLPPYGNGVGLRLISKDFSLSPSVAPNGAEIDFKVSQLPISGMYSFLAASKAGHPSICLAIPRRNGALAISFSHSEANLKWEILETDLDHHALPASNLSLDSWSAAILDYKDGNLSLLIPSDEGPCVVDFDLDKRKYATELAEGRCVGGVAKIQSNAYIPVFRNGKLEIACMKSGLWTYWTLDEYAQAETPSFGCPIVLQPIRKAIWVSRAGYILMERGRISFNEWPTGWSAKIEFGPPFESPEGYWQLCFNPSMDTFKYGYILIEKSSDEVMPEIKPVDGPRMNTGRICASKKSIYKNAPWGEPEQFGQEPFIIPLLQSPDDLLYLGVNIEIAPETASMTSLIESEENFNFNIRAKSSGIPLMTGRGKTPWRGSFFIFGHLLNFYSETQGEVCSWIIEK